MLHGPLAGKLLRFTLPIALSSMIQQLFNAADTSIVGYFDSADAPAAVGTNTEIVALIVTLSAGLSLGANILLAEHIGRGEHRHIPAIVQTAILLATAAGICGLMIGQGIARPLLRLIRTPADIFPAAESYLRICLLGYPFCCYTISARLFCGRGGDSRYPFVALMLSGLANVVLNLLFEPLCNLYEIPAGALRGAGHATLPAAGTMLGTCAFRILWICTAFRAHPSLPWLYRAFPLSWITTILLIALGFVLIRPFAAKPAVTPCAASQKPR